MAINAKLLRAESRCVVPTEADLEVRQTTT